MEKMLSIQVVQMIAIIIVVTFIGMGLGGKG